MSRETPGLLTRRQRWETDRSKRECGNDRREGSEAGRDIMTGPESDISDGSAVIGCSAFRR
jgi:hypothetical protein